MVSSDKKSPENKPIIKIDLRKKPKSKLKERAFRKLDLKVDRSEEFNIPTIQLTSEEMEKFDKFRDYCDIIRKCPRCKTLVNLLNISCNDDYELRGLCTDCMEYITDDTKEAKEYAIWLDKILDRHGGMSFKNGFPHLLRYEIIGKYCANCKRHHTTMQYVDLR